MAQRPQASRHVQETQGTGSFAEKPEDIPPDDSAEAQPDADSDPAAESAGETPSESPAEPVVGDTEGAGGA